MNAKALVAIALAAFNAYAYRLIKIANPRSLMQTLSRVNLLKGLPVLL